MHRVQVGLWPYAWGEQQDAGHCGEGGKSLGGAEGGHRGSIEASHRDVKLHEVDSIVPKEHSHDHTMDHVGVGVGG